MTAERRVSASPHLQSPEGTPRIMWSVVASLVPIVVVATAHFGVSALLVLAGSIGGAVSVERVFRRDTISDGSAVITGLLLGLALPPGLPIWMAFVGGAFGIGFGKLVFGGLGQNVFNPALLGRAFLQAAFPVALTTYPPPRAGGFWTLRGDNLAWPGTSPVPDAMTSATPLGMMKFDAEDSGFTDLLLGTTSGSIGETAGLLIIICGGYLALRNHLNWRIPASILGTVALLSWVVHLADPSAPGPAFMLFSGSILFGAFYYATDMVTSPVTRAGCWIFGAGIGALVVVIRLWGGLAEGVMYAILLMNALVPFIDRATQPRVYGTAGWGRRTA